LKPLLSEGWKRGERRYAWRETVNKRERRKNMNVEQIKYHTSPDGDEEGILLVDPETESEPLTDSEGNLQYYCVEGRYIFSIDDED